MPRPNRILCLHGMYQNPDVFAKKCNAIQSLLGTHVDLVHMEASHEVIPTPRLAHIRENHQVSRRQKRYFAWWKEGCTGWDTTLYEVIHNKIRTDGPFMGVLGFSQGATAAGLLCTNKISDLLNFRPKIAVIMSGRRSVIHDEEYKSGVISGLVSVHSYGLNDQVTPPASSSQLVHTFKTTNGTVYVHAHSGGHVIPSVDTEFGDHLLQAVSSVATEMK